MCVTAAPLQDSAILLFEPNEINDGTVFANQTAELFSTEGYVRYDVEILPETSSASVEIVCTNVSTIRRSGRYPENATQKTMVELRGFAEIAQKSRS